MGRHSSSSVQRGVQSRFLSDHIYIKLLGLEVVTSILKSQSPSICTPTNPDHSLTATHEQSRTFTVSSTSPHIQHQLNMVGTAHIIFLSSLLFDLALAQSLSGSPLAASTSKPKIKTKTKTKTYGSSSSRKKGKVVHWDELSKGAKIAIFVIIGLVVASIAICVILGAMGYVNSQLRSPPSLIAS